MKHTLLILFSLMALMASAQIRVPGTKVEFTLPEGQWKYLQTTKVDRNTNVYLYSYCGSLVLDAQGDTVLPFVRIYVRKNYTNAAFDLAADRWAEQPFQSLDEYTDGLPSDDGIGYIGAHTNLQDQKDYLFRMVYFKEKNTAIEFRTETTRDTYDRFDDVFKSIIESIEIVK